MYKPVKLTLKNFGSFESLDFDFRQNEPLVIVGENLDDSNQPRNGSGKSMLMEAIAIAISGDSIRSISMKELIRNGQESATIALTLNNSLLRTTIEIRRTLHVTKASKVELFINGEENKLSDVNEYNREILAMLDITKEDLFGFYIMTKEYYSPFLAAGDVKKKAIINRFSGADAIDKTSEKIDEDVAAVDETIKAIEKELSMNVGKQQLLSEQIREEEESYSEEGKKITMEAKNAEIAEVSNEVEVLTKRLEVGLEELAHQKELLEKKMLEAESDDIDAKKNELKEKKKALEEELNKATVSLSNLKESYKEDFDLIEAEKQTLKEAKASIKDSIKHCLELKTHEEAKLAGSIECPHCNKKFSLQDKDFDEKSIKESLKDIEDALVDFRKALAATEKDEEEVESLRDSLNNKLAKEQDAFRKAQLEAKQKIAQLRHDELALDEQIAEKQNEIKKIQRNIQSMTDTLASEQKRIDKLQETIAILQQELSKIADGKSDKIEGLEKNLLKLIDEHQKLSMRLNDKVIEKQNIEEWYTNFKNFKSYVANQSIYNIQDYTNHYLKQMGSNLSINIDGYKTLSNKKIKEQISVKVLRDGVEEGSYGKFSSGERARIDVSVIFAIQNLINLNCASGGLDLSILDEVMDSVDAAGLESIIQSLGPTKKTVMIVSQNEINSLQKNTLIVRKENRLSKLIIK